MIRLLGLDQNESYRLLYTSVREIETENIKLQMRIAEARRQQTELHIAVSQCKSAAGLVERWIGVKDEIRKLNSEMPKTSNGQTQAKAYEERKKLLEEHEKEIAEALGQYINGDQLGKDIESLVALQMNINHRHGQLLATYEACAERYRKEEMILSSLQSRKEDQDAALVKTVDAAFQMASATLSPERIQNPSEQNIRVWNEVQSAYRILRNVQLHRKYICSDSEAEFYKELAKLRLGNAESQNVTPKETQIFTQKVRQAPEQCRMPIVVEESSDSTSRLTTVTMNWLCSNAEDGMTEYQLQQRGSSGNDFEVVYEGKETDCILDLLPDAYVFRVRARNSAGTSSFSAELVYVAHDAPEKKKSVTMQKAYRAQMMSDAKCRSAEENLTEIVKDMIENGSDAEKAESLAVSLNEGRKNKLDLVSQELFKRGTNLLKGCWKVPEVKVQGSQSGVKFSSLTKDLLSQKSPDSFQKLIRSEIWNSLSQKSLDIGYNYLVILALRALRLNYPPVVVDGSLHVLNAAMQAKVQPSNPFWARRIQNLFDLLRRKLQQQWVQAKLKENAKDAEKTEEQRKIREKQQEELEKKKVKEKREAERQAARLREQKRKALHEKLWRQQVAQGKVLPKTVKAPPAKPSPPIAPAKPVPKFRSYPKHHQQGKFQLCKFWLVGQSCRKQPCWFAHGKEELADWYRQREDEQARKKGHKKANSEKSASPAESPAPQPKPSPSSSPVEPKEPPKTRPVKASPAPVVKSVWQKNSTSKKQSENNTTATSQQMSEDAGLVAKLEELSGMWQGKSTQRNGVMIWQSCNLNFNFQGQRGKFIGSCICTWNGETVSFKIEGQLRYPEMTLIRQASQSFPNKEIFQLRIEKNSGQIQMSGKSGQGWLTLIRTPGKDNKRDKLVGSLPQQSPISQLLPSPATAPIAPQRSVSVDAVSFTGPRGDAFNAPRVASLLDGTSKSTALFSSFGVISETSKNNSPVTIGPLVGHSPASEPAADQKSSLSRPLGGGMGTMFNSTFGGSKVWGSLNASRASQETETKLKVGSNTDQAGAAIGSAPGRNGFSSFLSRQSKSTGSGPFGFSSATGSVAGGQAGFGSLFSSMRSTIDPKWNVPSTSSSSVVVRSRTSSFEGADPLANAKQSKFTIGQSLNGTQRSPLNLFQ